MLKNSYVESRNCPNCNSLPEFSTPVISAKVTAESLSDLELKEFFIGFREEQCFFTYNRCNKCAQLYCPQYFTQEALNDLYSSMPDNTSVSGERDSAKTQSGYVSLIPTVPSKFSYLEIGADIGLLASAAQSKLGLTHISAIEPNLGVHDELTKTISSELEIYTSSEQLPKDSKFDCVSAIHVVDHLLNPVEELRRISEHMKSNSQFLIVVHNEKSLLRKLLKKKWPPFCLQHPQLYSRETLAQILESSGLRTIRIKRTRNYIGLNHGLGLLKSIGLFPKNSNFKLPNWSFPIALGNISVLCEKI